MNKWAPVKEKVFLYKFTNLFNTSVSSLITFHPVVLAGYLLNCLGLESPFFFMAQTLNKCEAHYINLCKYITR